MKNFITKYWALIGLILAFVLDHSFQILSGFGLSEIQIDLTKGLGALIYGYFFTSNYNKEVSEKIIGGRPNDR